jgi:hypothetical protein
MSVASNVPAVQAQEPTWPTPLWAWQWGGAVHTPVAARARRGPCRSLLHLLDDGAAIVRRAEGVRGAGSRPCGWMTNG